LEELRIQEAQFEREGNLAGAAEIKHGKIPKAKQNLEEKSSQLQAAQGERSLLREEVGREDIAQVVSAWTGIPVDKMLSSEKVKYLKLEDILGAQVIGQAQAVQAISNAIRRNKSGLSSPDKPLGSFIFLGPTGVGKTELAKKLAGFLFDDEASLTRIDMSEYMEKFAVSRLVGAPPGYVGYEEGGQLTEAVRRRPYSVVLFDEIEKAHPDVFNLLLQLLDDGRLTDSQGRVVDFRNSIIIMTSNLGSDIILRHQGDPKGLKDELLTVLRGHFKPEFLNRVDEIITFNQLDEAAIQSIVLLQMKDLETRLAEQRLSIEVSPEGLIWLGKMGYDPLFGARPLKRTMQNQLYNPLSRLILEGSYPEGSVIHIALKKDELVFS
jgi:ATP-dependent Clp protease ATP-binding subunit ClpB